MLFDNSVKEFESRFGRLNESIPSTPVWKELGDLRVEEDEDAFVRGEAKEGIGGSELV